MAVLGHQFAPPYDDCMPAEEAELDAFLYVAVFVAFYLLLPELAITLWQYIVPAVFVAVPEAAVDKDDGLVLAQDDVGGAGEPAHVDSVAVTARVQVTAHEHLGLGVFALDACHTSVSLLNGHPVCHGAKILFFLDFMLGFCWKNLLGLNVWIYRVFIIFLVHLIE